MAAVLAGASCTAEPDTVAPTTSLTLPPTSETALNDTIVRYGVATSPANPWAHYRTSCDTTCALVFGAITDTLFATTPEGEAVGLLIERFDSNTDHTIHTWRLRDGIEFSDGTPLDAAAVRTNIEACRHSLLTGPGLAGIDDVRAEGLTLTITTLAPWATLAYHFAETPCGHMFSAAWLASLPDLPMRSEGAPFFDAEIAARPATGDPAAPVGLGPYVMTSFAPGNGNSTVLSANPTHWRGPNGITGESLPRLPEIELVVIGDPATRATAFEAGQFALLHTRQTTIGRDLADIATTVTSTMGSELTHLVLNGAAGEALADPTCRAAIDAAVDRAALADAMGIDPTTGPFSVSDAPDAAAVASPDAPAFDPELARVAATTCQADSDAPVMLRLVALDGDRRAGLVAEMIERSISADDGIAVRLEPVDPDALAVAALLGDFDLLLWDGFGGLHPDLHFQRWFGEAATPVGSVTSNVGRTSDVAIDAAAVELRRSDGPAEVDAAAEGLRSAHEDGDWIIWLGATPWTVAARTDVDLDLVRTTPEGIELVPLVNGAHSLSWLDR